MGATIHRFEVEARGHGRDALAAQTAARLSGWLGQPVDAGAIATRRVYHLDLGLDDDEAARVLAAVVDPVAQTGAVGMLPDPWPAGTLVLEIGLRPGVTDAVGATVHRAAADCLGRPLHGAAYSSLLFAFWGPAAESVASAAQTLLCNPLIQRARRQSLPRTLVLEVPRAGATDPPRVEHVALRDADDETLQRISQQGMLALSLLEMRAIAAHFRDRGRDPTDAELECLAQTWSEHCKHKIFASPIELDGPDGARRVQRGLFREYIRGATEAVAAARVRDGIDPPQSPWLVSVFHDNAGVVRFTDADHLVYKVETHNSPSALDPYGGAMTGIVGVNRDSFGTGLGADLLTNVWGYCFGAPDHAAPLPAGLMHPRRIREGVHHGVIDGGNQSGIPYSRGFELFDARYVGKPLVFCGTVAAMPVTVAGRPTHDKCAAPGDAIVMVGGRIGKDGIHGATFSSVRLDESAPVQAVQIGDPITQKMMFDMLTVARDRGLFSSMTDNGAGGLSSSVGEMATSSGGAELDLSLAPLKYPGLQPWEVLVSEAQERMTVAVPPAQLDAFLALAQRYEVLATVLGRFTDSGRLVVRWGETEVADLSLAFLHDGVPLPPLPARLEPHTPQPPQLSALREPGALGAELLALFETPEHARTAELVRHYDHEVKGLSVIKPLVGVARDVPASATVMRVRHGRREGVVLGEGVHPFYADHDAAAMARACVDEGVRKVLCAGARIDRIAALDNFCWPDPVRSDRTPDGAHKLAQLVACCEGLYQACVAYGVPLISGKDSMKNDAFIGGTKISIPPTLLVSVMGQIDDVATALDPVLVAGSDLWLLGETRGELGGSSLLRRWGQGHAGAVPQTDPARLWPRYRAFAALVAAGRVRSAAALSRGGLAVALGHALLAGGVALEIALDAVAADPVDALFSESTGRVLFSSAPADRAEIETQLGPHGLVALGRSVDATAELRATIAGATVLRLAESELRARWTAAYVD
ncbi:MAG: hypothetical protein K1X88_24790 [Nannocystaceae bacterium]|nr:hypothetical protein [Nannocystaceae bacterium]